MSDDQPVQLPACSRIPVATEGGETVLTGLFEDRSALFGVLAQIEALGLDLLELRQIRAGPQSPEPGDDRSPDGV
jgi:hypothetical protein